MCLLFLSILMKPEFSIKIFIAPNIKFHEIHFPPQRIRVVPFWWTEEWTDTRRSYWSCFATLEMHEKQLVCFHAEVTVKFFIKYLYLWYIFILLLDCCDSLNLTNLSLINRLFIFTHITCCTQKFVWLLLSYLVN